VEEGAVPVEAEHVLRVPGHGCYEDLLGFEMGGESGGARWDGVRGGDEVCVEEEEEEEGYEERFGLEKFPPERAREEGEHGCGEGWRGRGRVSGS